MVQRLLMIEDDRELAAMVATYLAKSGLEVSHAASAKEGLKRLPGGGFDAVLLDLMLPDLDGFEVCRRIRAGSDIPILMLTARGDDTDRIVGLEIGADDYLPKPFNPRELLARLRAVLRRGRAAGEPPAVMRFGRLEIDAGARIVRLDGAPTSLTGYQFDLLCLLAENAGRVMSRAQLMDRLHGRTLEAFDRSIDVHISRIRAALEDHPKQPQRILTVRGIGYVFARTQDGSGHR